MARHCDMADVDRSIQKQVHVGSDALVRVHDGLGGQGRLLCTGSRRQLMAEPLIIEECCAAMGVVDYRDFQWPIMMAGA